MCDIYAVRPIRDICDICPPATKPRRTMVEASASGGCEPRPFPSNIGYRHTAYISRIRRAAYIPHRAAYISHVRNIRRTAYVSHIRRTAYILHIRALAEYTPYGVYSACAPYVPRFQGVGQGCGPPQTTKTTKWRLAEPASVSNHVVPP